MTERTWEVMGRHTMIPSLGKIGMFKGQLATSCGWINTVPVTVDEVHTKEGFEVIKIVKDSAPYHVLFGNK